MTICKCAVCGATCVTLYEIAELNSLKNTLIVCGSCLDGSETILDIIQYI